MSPARPTRARGGRPRRVLRRLDDLDLRVFDAVAGHRSPALDATMPALTRAADHSKLWIALGAGLAALPSRRTRAAARRGLLSVAVSSLLVNQVGKRLFPRGRPDLAHVPMQRIAHRVPKSSSFPSGHSASAAAFAVGVAIDAPEFAIPIGLAAAAVGFSRVYTGVHYPGDVLVGAAAGAGIAAAGAALFPRVPEPDEPAPAVRVQEPPRPDGAGVHIVVNPGSGPAPGGREEVAMLRRHLPHAQVRMLTAGDDLVDALRHAGDAAARARGVLGVYGGDGSVNAAAAVAIERDLPLLVLPGGTLNHFARDLDLDHPADAVRAVRAGTAMRVDVGEVAGEIFLNTASLGSYPSFVAVREKWQQRLGKPLAAVLAVDKVLRREPPLPVRVDGHHRSLAALFVGTGRYLPAGSLPSRRPRLDSGVLDVRFLDVGGPAWRLLTAVQLLTRRGDPVGAFVHQETPELTLHLTGSDEPDAAGEEHTLLARDGEIGPVAGPSVTFRIRPAALTVFRNWTT